MRYVYVCSKGVYYEPLSKPFLVFTNAKEMERELRKAGFKQRLRYRMAKGYARYNFENDLTMEWIHVYKVRLV